ncbi:hypothetical protein ES332_D01G144900v1 [Gossypium tomentosum]|uniref:Uncharacterized protein n=1 Tax=Gossypium tomentosum TaxID=34277 RepID=A0A5D2M974_GOSTO|nr:hypothetical protein ES332_D01G144900v1 [Gossypium tomentosum]
MRGEWGKRRNSHDVNGAHRVDNEVEIDLEEISEYYFVLVWMLDDEDEEIRSIFKKFETFREKVKNKLLG